jgi:hypothetical protein
MGVTHTNGNESWPICNCVKSYNNVSCNLKWHDIVLSFHIKRGDFICYFDHQQCKGIWPQC